MYYFFSTDVSNDTITLPKDESNHCIKVLRHDVGDTIYIVDGKGMRFTSKISKKTNNYVEAEIIAKEELSAKSDYYIHIVMDIEKV